MSAPTELATGMTRLTASRFTLVGYLPTYAALAYLGLLLAARAAGGGIEVSRALSRLHGHSGAVLAGLALGALLLAVLLHPLQAPLVRLLEGYWPRPARAAARYAVKLQERARDRLDRAAEVVTAHPTGAERQRILAAAWQLARSFPPPTVPLLPTALGNTLRAGEATAGAAYGADAVVWWPRLYPLLGDGLRAVVDDRRDQLDLACRLSATAGATGLLSVPLVLGSDGWWPASPAVFLLAARVAYRAAVAAARGYAETLSAAFDLHRFDLVTALHLPLPPDSDAEQVLNRRLTRFWAQGVPLTALPYQHEHEHGHGHAHEPAPPPAVPGGEGSP
ncbi:hypothetical protein WDV06_06480 [Streptomyces racemochromogenes]|uniref:Uncharacterized protein n=1 Tax=Streptomyces racemochromogenes TaxID=67353 RepID=A0ABW7P8R2_9ACTN